MAWEDVPFCRARFSCVRYWVFAGFLFVIASLRGWGAGFSCAVVPAHIPGEAELVFQKGDHAKAAEMLAASLEKTPNDPEQSALLVRALLWPRKTAEAADVLAKALKAHPDSPALLTEQAEVVFRAGRPWEAASALAAALKADPCYARAYLIYSWLMGAQSNRLSERKAILLAHQIDPNDAEIRSYWMNTLPLTERIPALEAWIAAGTVTDAEEQKRMKTRLERVKELESEPPSACRLVSEMRSTGIALQDIVAQRHGAISTTNFALSVGVNDHQGLLVLGSDAGGLGVSKALADRAGIKPMSLTPVYGEKPEGMYRGHADKIQIGNLEFRDCLVTVVEKGMTNQDGWIGLSAFSQFLVTIDYPMRKIVLDPLPSPANQSVTEEPSLATAGDALDADFAASGAGGVLLDDLASPRAADRYISPTMSDWVRIYRVGAHLIVPTSMHPPDLKLFLVDSSLWTTMVDLDAAREVTKVDLNGNLRLPSSLGVPNVYVAESLDLWFGGISKHEMGIPAVSLDQRSMLSATHISGVLGQDILADLTLHIDYRDGLMKFEYDPKRGYHPPVH